jgi:hypothetical protein
MRWHQPSCPHSSVVAKRADVAERVCTGPRFQLAQESEDVEEYSWLCAGIESQEILVIVQVGKVGAFGKVGGLGKVGGEQSRGWG